MQRLCVRQMFWDWSPTVHPQTAFELHSASLLHSPELASHSTAFGRPGPLLAVLAPGAAGVVAAGGAEVSGEPDGGPDTVSDAPPQATIAKVRSREEVFIVSLPRATLVPDTAPPLCTVKCPPRCPERAPRLCHPTRVHDSPATLAKPARVMASPGLYAGASFEASASRKRPRRASHLSTRA